MNRKKKDLKRNRTSALVWHSINVAVFAILELAMWYFVPILTITKFIPEFIVFIVIVLYAWKGYRENKDRFSSFLIIVIALVLFDISESFVIGDFTALKAILILVVYAAFVCTAYLVLWNQDKQDLLVY